LAEFHFHNIRDYSTDKHKRVDDYAYSGGGGMVMMIQPIADCITALKKERAYDEIIYTAPDGEMLTQPLCNQMSSYKNLLILCGHYKGIDERIREHFITKEISIGNYVLTGGELAAAVIADSIVRLIPGVLNDEMSALSDSFQDGLVSPPVYTRPFDYNGWKVPEILISGNERQIKEWKLEQAVKRTEERRGNLM
jgi:tRNA (guanine37-N1)-methyltransferase